MGGMLSMAIADGRIDDSEKAKLREYREAHCIGCQVHLRQLEVLGWTLDEYEAGVQNNNTPARSNSAQQMKASVDLYLAKLMKVVEDGIINEKERTNLDTYRHDNAIDEDVHESVLKCIGWTTAEYKAGVRAAHRGDLLAEIDQASSKPRAQRRLSMTFSVGQSSLICPVPNLFAREE